MVALQKRNVRTEISADLDFLGIHIVIVNDAVHSSKI